MWYTSNCFAINVSKTHACVFRNKKLSDPINRIKAKFKADSCKNILSSNLDSHPTFKTHAHHVATETNHIPIPRSEVLHECSVSSKVLHYLQSPKANDCSSHFINVWAIFTTQLNAPENKSVRVILKAPKAFSVSEGKLLLNIPVLKTYHMQLFHKFTSKILKQKSSFLYLKSYLFN